MLASCEPEPKPELSPLYPGEYRGTVLFDVCGNITVQFSDGTRRGQMGWRTNVDTFVHNNVFRVANPCTWGWDGQSREIRFAMVMGPEINRCVQCLGWMMTPDTAYNIRVLK